MMKRLLLILLALSLLLTGCSSNNVIGEIVESPDSVEEAEDIDNHDVNKPEELVVQSDQKEQTFHGFDDPNYLTYVEDRIYKEIVNQTKNEDFFVDNIEAVYVSEEYLEEMENNSRENIFFGYTLSNLDEEFDSKRYVFSLGDDGTTVVREFKEYGDSYEKIAKNVAVGAGVIVVFVTASVATGSQTDLAVVHMVFTLGAKRAVTKSLELGFIKGVVSGVIKAIETGGDFEEVLKSATVSASEGFKWGAVVGATTGSAEEYYDLLMASQNGLSVAEAALIQKEGLYPLEFIRCIHSMDEYKIYRDAGLVSQHLENGRQVLNYPEIDWNIKDQYGRTNVERVLSKLAPIGPDGNSFHLHHVGQKADGPLAVLTQTAHQAYSKILHYADEGKDIEDSLWREQKTEVWMQIARMAGVIE